MAISRIELNDFLVFKGEFATNFCPGVNVLIGGNGTGKSTILKTIYNCYCLFRGDDKHGNLNQLRNEYLTYFSQIYSDISPKIFSDINGNSNVKEEKYNKFSLFFNFSSHDYSTPNEQNMCLIDISTVFIPEKDILEHAKGLLTFIEQKQSGFSQIYKDVLVSAQDIPTNQQVEMQQRIRNIIADTIGGEVEYDINGGEFVTIRTDGSRIPFSYEASGFKKLGFLCLLVKTGQLKTGTILFWDEPENSLNPELIPVLVDILLELSRNGVQIFLATHSEIFANYFSVNKQEGDCVMFYSLYKDGEQIRINSNDRFDLLTPNKLTEEPVKLYMKELDRGLENV